MVRGSLTLGRYVARQSPLHALDAAAKVLCAACLALASVWNARLELQAGLAILLGGAFAVGRLPVRLGLQALRGVAWLLVVVVAANRGWAALGGASAQTLPFAELVLLVMRLVVLALLSVLFTATTVPVDLAYGMQRLLRPLQRLRFPAQEFGFLLVLALSFVPIFFAEAHGLLAVHRSKSGGARWGAWDRLRAVVPLAVPLFLSVLRRADELAVALDARCFVAGRRRSAYVPPRFGVGEIACLVFSLLVLLVSLGLPH